MFLNKYIMKQKLKNPNLQNSQSFDKDYKKNDFKTNLEKFMELYKSKSKISIYEMKKII